VDKLGRLKTTLDQRQTFLIAFHAQCKSQRKPTDAIVLTQDSNNSNVALLVVVLITITKNSFIEKSIVIQGHHHEWFEGGSLAIFRLAPQV
jgi:hypothetical protein